VKVNGSTVKTNALGEAKLCGLRSGERINVLAHADEVLDVRWEGTLNKRGLSLIGFTGFSAERRRVSAETGQETIELEYYYSDESCAYEAPQVGRWLRFVLFPTVCFGIDLGLLSYRVLLLRAHRDLSRRKIRILFVIRA